MSNLQAVLFDFDGVLLDTSDQLFEGYKKVFSGFGIDYQESQFNENYGLKTKEHIAKVLKENDIELHGDELDDLVVERDKFYQEKCAEVSEPLPGVVGLLDELRTKNLNIGVASSTSRENLDYFLPKIGIQKYFDLTLAGTEVNNGKPHPEIYLKLCDQFQIEPKNCAGFEDTDKGIEALKNAGIFAIAVTLTNRKEYDFSKADLVVETLDEIDIARLTSILNP